VAEPVASPRPVAERDDVLHVIVRAEEDGSFYVRSPQVPGLAYGADSLDAAHGGLEHVLAFALDRPGPFRLVEHHERRFEAAGREVVLRVAVDEHEAQRRATYARLAPAVSTPEQADVVLAAPADVVGETLFICSVPSDPVSWIAAQLDSGGAAILAVAVADELLLTYRVHVDDGGPEQPRSEGATVADIVRARPIVQPVSGSLAVS
jgi:hypothetical protein